MTAWPVEGDHSTDTARRCLIHLAEQEAPPEEASLYASPAFWRDPEGLCRRWEQTVRAAWFAADPFRVPCDHGQPCQSTACWDARQDLALDQLDQTVVCLLDRAAVEVAVFW